MQHQPLVISLEKAYEVRHWMRTFHCTEHELYDAVQHVGLSIASIRQYRACRIAAITRSPLTLH